MLLAWRPSPFDPAWARLLLLLAPLVLVPLGLRLARGDDTTDARLWQAAHIVQLPAAVLLGVAFLLPQGLPAGILALPWLALTGLLVLLGVRRIGRHGFGPLDALCVNAALVFMAVGGGWAVLQRLGERPLGFEAVIVLLTAIHFHYAGFVLPLLAGLAIRDLGGRTSRLAGVGVLAGVPLVALGITATQLQLGRLPESLAAWVLALAGVLVALLHARLAQQRSRHALIRILWALSALSLAASMALAALYGARFHAPLGWLDIPWMRALHGTANALGFALPGLLGWTLIPSPPHCVQSFSSGPPTVVKRLAS
jgi:hypothetical protein